MAPVAAGAGLPALPGLPGSEEAERALGIRRPVYIPATHERKIRPGSWRIVSGVLSVVLFCAASCGVAGLLGHSKIESWLAGPIKTLQTPTSFDYSLVPATPTSTPGPDASYVRNPVTALGHDNANNPVHPTTHFVLAQSANGTSSTSVYLTAQVRGIPKGQQHTVWYRWYLNSEDLGLGRTLCTPSATNCTMVSFNSGDQNLYTLCVYPKPGIGMVKIYWDIPSSDSGDASNDAHLAQTVMFGIYAPTPTPGTSPSASPTSTGGTPAKGTATPTRGADLGPGPVARRETSADGGV
jgi:hypothetical protein